MRYRCVDAQKAAGFPVVAACQAAGVTRSGYYAWTPAPTEQLTATGRRPGWSGRSAAATPAAMAPTAPQECMPSCAGVAGRSTTSGWSA